MKRAPKPATSSTVVDWAAPLGPSGGSGPVYRRPATDRGSSRRSGVLRTKRDVIAFLGGDSEALDDWTSYKVPRSRRSIWMPAYYSGEWDHCVDTIRSAVDTDVSSTLGWVRREEICSSGQVWFVVRSDDNDEPTVLIVGEFADQQEALWECIKRSERFYAGPGRTAVGPEEVEDLLGSPERLAAEVVDDPEMWVDSARTALTLRVATDLGVELVGVDVVSAMPSTDPWWLIPMTESERDDLRVSGCELLEATVTVKGVSTTAALASLPESYGQGLALAFGLREVIILARKYVYVVSLRRDWSTVRFRRDLTDVPTTFPMIDDLDD